MKWRSNLIDFENLPRWIYASASKVIDANAPITFIEGLDRDDDPKEGAEFRMDGPRLTKLHGYWKIWTAINILVKTTMESTNFHQKYIVIGEVVNALNTHIPVYRYGNGPQDDNSFVGCLSVIHDEFNRIQVNHFGQVDKTVRLEQATIEAKYLMYLKED